ncbi:MAG: putative aliphatic sulfonates-binding protein precursor [Smithella sp. PtaU1.Bin162]|nr:MAG: putative aliphatic sulfonates-binding protein precursor [Smithella sp. PtaU1.Bin162]
MIKSLVKYLLVALTVIGFMPGKESIAGQPFMLATAGTGGTYYVIGGAMADVMRKFDNTKVTPLTTNGSIENLRLVSGKRVAIGFSTPDLAYYAYNGTEMYKEGGKLDNLRYVGGGHMGAMQVVVPSNSPVKQIADLKGKKVAVGAQGSAVLTLSLDVLAVDGLEITDIKPAYLSMSEMTEALQDGVVDAAIYSAGVPTSSITNIFSRKDMRIIPYSEKKVKTYLAKRGPEKKALLKPYTLPAKTYSGQNEAVPCMAFRACLVAHKDVPDALIYSFLKTIEGHVVDLKRVHPSGAEYTLTQLEQGAAIPLHPGAAKFYAEKGVKIEIIK